MVEDFDITVGHFDSVANCDYRVPGVIPIGSVCADLILDVMKKEDTQQVHEIFYEVFTSFISEEISNFIHGAYYENPSYIYNSYLEGELL